MNVLKFPIKELGGRRLNRLAYNFKCSDAQAIGVLLLFWHSSRQAGFESGPHDEAARHIPVMYNDLSPVEALAAFATAGYVTSPTPGITAIVDNVGYNAKAAWLSENGKRAAAARTSRSKPPATKAARKPKGQALTLVDTNAQAANKKTWEAYSESYTRKMGQSPVRNAKSNSLIAQFVKRIGGGDAPHVIAFFVQHPNQKYMGRLYQLEMAVSDAESLRTQWANDTAITQNDFKHFDEQLAIDRDRQRILDGR